jgi:two-component system sensor histidine kinase YesM
MKKKKVNILFRFRNLRTTIMIPFLLLLTAAVLVFMFISVTQSRAMMMDTSTDYTSQLVSMINSDIDSYFTNMENIAQLINSSDARTYLQYSESDRNTSEYLNCKWRLESQFRTLRETRDDIYNIGILGLNGNYLINKSSVKINPNADLDNMFWYKRALSGKEAMVYSHVQNVVQGEYPWVVTLSRPIVDPDTGKTEGVLFIDMNYRSIANLCEKTDLGSKGYVFIIDQEGTIVYHPKQQLLYSGLQTEEIGRILAQKNGSFSAEDGKRIYTISRSELTGCTIVGVAYLTEMMQRSDGMRNLLIMLAALLISVAAVVSALLAKMISSPIRNLGESMKQIEQKDFDTHIENPGYTNVIGDLIRSFNIMVERIRELIRRIQDEQAEKRKSELSALQAQINPHFLYNTLDSIIWMSESGKNPEVIQMTSSLSKLLRKSISNDAEFVTVKDEIEYASEYLKIQKMRYHDKLDYRIDIAPEIQRQSIAKLLIQPLVENAIYHGIKLKENGGMIRITGERDGDTMVIVIEDDGAGMDQETMQHLFDVQPEKDVRKVGVQNVNRRIQLYYGVQFGLHYESTVGVGTTVRVILPYREGTV